ncbi:MAG TPA: hypothetical protein VJ846_01190 [Sphingomicrobium sp.]|nr:hypothetical protein [Sphingomicrobium sp.]
MTRHRRAFKSFWSDPDASMSLGCVDCPNLHQCGGQTISGDGFNCLDHCCQKPGTCQVVCLNAKIFADRVREVEGLELETPLATPVPAPIHAPYLPLIFHGSARADHFVAPAIAMPLYRFFDRTANCRFSTRNDVAEAFKIDPAAKLLLSGVAQDHEVERWWKLETSGRIKAIANLRRMGIAMVTTPNFSLMVDRPRWDDLHSIKRIAEVYHEFVSEGQAAALHVNGRTRHDFVRWGEYIAAHPEVTHLAYEFTTGAKSPARMFQHAQWLTELAKASDRRLGLVLRGGTQVLASLSTHYQISFIDSSPFEKAMHRAIATLGADGQRGWLKRLTTNGEPIDALLAENVRVSERWFARLLPKLALAA